MSRQVLRPRAGNRGTPSGVRELLPQRATKCSAGRTEREALPEPKADEALARTIERVNQPLARTIQLDGRRPQLWLAVAAVLVVVAGATAIVLADRDDPGGVSTGGDDDPTPVTTSRSATTTSMPTTTSAALADLNGDGRLEIVVDMQHYEGHGTSVYELGSDGSPAEVLSTGGGV